MKTIIDQQRDYLLSCQLPSGTFLLGPKRSQINPYFTNLALVSLVRLEQWQAVQRHVEWYLHHVNSDGYVNDYEVKDNTEIDTGKADSEDSYNATLFSLLAEMLKVTMDTSWLVPWIEVLASMLRGIAILQQKDGLTWAKRTYRVKYVMDNCEVAKGLEDAAYVFRVMGNDNLAQEAASRGDACRKGIQSMYSQLRKSYAMYDRTYPGWRKWYPDVTSQVFPIVYAFSGPNEAAAVYDKIVAAFPRFDTFQTGDVYPWMVMGEGARLMGDAKRVDNMLTTARQLYIEGPRLPYWLIHEAGRFVELCLSASYLPR